MLKAFSFWTLNDRYEKNWCPAVITSMNARPSSAYPYPFSVVSCLIFTGLGTVHKRR